MRKCKVGIDYFSHDVDTMQDKKIKLLKAKHGLAGYAVYFRLLEELYKESGFYLKCDNDFNTLFADDNNLDYNVYILILNDCIKEELFNNKLYKAHGILTSKRIQENYCMATDRRKEVVFYKEYLLIDVQPFYKKDVNVNIIDLNTDINTQKKRKEIGKESIDVFFESIWLLYPKKEGKAAVSATQKQVLYKIGIAEIKLCIERYKKEKVGVEKRYLQMGSTFFNGGYEDYLDKNYNKQEMPRQKKKMEIVEIEREL